MSRPPTLLLIRGLGHSGTTILDLALGAHPLVMGLGEAARILQTPKPGEEQRGPAMLRGAHRYERRCTCGAIAAECPVWGPMLRWLDDHDDQALPIKMQQLVQIVSQLEGPTPELIVDSYQDDFELSLDHQSELNRLVLHLTRDVRSWVHSRSRSARDRGAWFSEWRPLLRWVRTNARHEMLLKRSTNPLFRLGYEELALDPRHHLERLCDWLNLDFSEAMLRPGYCSSSHILSGNRVRFDPKRTGKITYDGAWLSYPSGLAQIALLTPWVAAMNRRLVYSGQLKR